MDKAIVSLSFDDGRIDNYDAFRKITIPRKIPVTLNVISGYIDGTFPSESWPSKRAPMTKEQVIELSKNPLVEIALHGDTHKNTETDVRTGKEKLTEWIGQPEGERWGFASPYSRLPVKEFTSSTSPSFFKDDILYMRTGLKNKHLSTPRIICSKASKVLPLPFLYKAAFENVIMDKCSDRVLYSFPILKATSLSHAKGIVDAAIWYKGAVTIMLHSIDPDTTNSDDWSWSEESFKKFCDYLVGLRDRDKLDIMTSRDLYKRIKIN